MIYLTIYCQKAKFYLTWTLADAVNNASGLGFNGYKASGEPQWNLVTNINIFKLEVMQSNTHIDSI
jgi:lysophospholipid acyltransferase 1/2